ncbi:hypothetical protein N7466_003501 [Penicillium verhagenii]|uniref:uncharacterized protein n=1 Tax=Penicillium verhagenii TaxID=1562060 RepID=UPI002545B907|nr:uncharacterized protein N7466_003501 [Penicillium verhagenii]KAJ5937051.1 hypothetical protein N7466_003501 [Penicillium verhagenii]
MTLSEGSARSFTELRLPLYHGPTVKIQIRSSHHEYEVSKNILCRNSTYFAAMFEGKFQEGRQQTATLQEMSGVVSVRSFESLIQWLYLGIVKFDYNGPEDGISAAIELVRLADMCNITGMECSMAQHIKDILVANPEPRRSSKNSDLHHSPNTYCLTREHIISTTNLPVEHPDTQGFPSFAVDLLHEVDRR